MVLFADVDTRLSLSWHALQGCDGFSWLQLGLNRWTLQSYNGFWHCNCICLSLSLNLSISARGDLSIDLFSCNIRLLYACLSIHFHWHTCGLMVSIFSNGFSTGLWNDVLQVGLSNTCLWFHQGSTDDSSFSLLLSLSHNLLSHNLLLLLLCLLVLIDKYLDFFEAIHFIIDVCTQVAIVVVRSILGLGALHHLVRRCTGHLVLEFLLGWGTQDLAEVKVTRKLRLLSALIDHDVACLVVGVAVLDHIGALMDTRVPVRLQVDHEQEHQALVVQKLLQTFERELVQVVVDADDLDLG